MAALYGFGLDCKPMLMIRRLLKGLLGSSLKPFFEHYYLKRRRVSRFDSLVLQVEPGVFHPGLFFSSRFLARYIQRQPLEGRRFLDLGCGSGLLSLVAASLGAEVTAVDINPAAVSCTQGNARRNSLLVDARISDLFKALAGQRFDLIVVNPPYYPGAPSTPADHAWYCGSGFEYFAALFSGAAAHLTAGAHLHMVLSDDCDLEKIFTIARSEGFRETIVETRNYLIETNMIIVFRNSAAR